MNFYYNPVRLHWGEQCLSELKGELESLQAKKILIIKWSDNALDNQAGNKLYEAVGGCEVMELTFERSNPDIQ